MDAIVQQVPGSRIDQAMTCKWRQSCKVFRHYSNGVVPPFAGAGMPHMRCAFVVDGQLDRLQRLL